MTTNLNQHQRVVTIVATVTVPSWATDDQLAEMFTAYLVREGASLIPCDWAPDADTISDAVGGRPVTVVDLNPGSVDIVDDVCASCREPLALGDDGEVEACSTCRCSRCGAPINAEGCTVELGHDYDGPLL